MKGKNRIGYVPLICLLTIGGLLSLYWLPQQEIAGHALRQVDILSSLRPPNVPVDIIKEDTVVAVKPVQRVFVDTCRTGMTCIEDYADSTERGMLPFYQALADLTIHPRPVRIAYFGDSFIEGDIMTGDLRELLQQAYGGHGVGLLPVASNIDGFRTSVRLFSQGWGKHFASDGMDFDHHLQGIGGYYFYASPKTWTELRGEQTYAHSDTCFQSSLFFVGNGDLTISARVNRRKTSTYNIAPTGQLQQISIHDTIGSVRWNIEQAESTVFYGVSMEDSTGITLDNFSLRGASGQHLRRVPSSMLEQANKLRPYDLIILHYGMNMVEKNRTNYDGYAEVMHDVIRRLKEYFPQAGILLVSVPDRDAIDSDGVLRTMPGVLHMVPSQQQVAMNEHVAFWNLFEAMGGRESMERLVESKPSKANLDYTHINFRGGQYVARLLFDALIYGKEQYDRRRDFESD